MGKETIEALEKQYPKWVIGQAYGGCPCQVAGEQSR